MLPAADGPADRHWPRLVSPIFLMSQNLTWWLFSGHYGQLPLSPAVAASWRTARYLLWRSSSRSIGADTV